MHVELSKQVDRPPADVWRYIAEHHLENHPKWDPAITKLEQEGSGPLGVGAQLHMVRKDMGREIPMEMEFTAWDPNHKMAFEVDAKQMHMNAHMALVAQGDDATQLTIAVDAEGKGFAKAMMPMMGGRMKKQITASLDHIKDALEGS